MTKSIKDKAIDAIKTTKYKILPGSTAASATAPAASSASLEGTAFEATITGLSKSEGLTRVEFTREDGTVGTIGVDNLIAKTLHIDQKAGFIDLEDGTVLLSSTTPPPNTETSGEPTKAAAPAFKGNSRSSPVYAPKYDIGRF